MHLNKTIIFGAGKYGKDAFNRLGEEQVVGFIDNNIEKQKSLFCGKPVFSLEQAASMRCHILIASKYSAGMEKQLREYGIEDYSVFLGHLYKFYETDELVINPYEARKEVQTEKEWNSSDRLQYTRTAVYDETAKLYENVPLFEAIEVETINRCNGTCSFCPVNRNADPREYAIMTEELFRHNHLAFYRYVPRSI